MTRIQLAKVGAAALFLGSAAYFIKNPRLKPARTAAVKTSDTPQRVKDSDTPQRVKDSDTPQRVLLSDTPQRASDTPQRVRDSDTPQRDLLSDTPQRVKPGPQERPECVAARKDAGERLKGLNLADGSFWSLPRNWRGAAGVVFDEASGQPIGFFRPERARLELFDLWGKGVGGMSISAEPTQPGGAGRAAVVSASAVPEALRLRLRSAVPPAFPAPGQGILPDGVALSAPHFSAPAGSRLGKDKRGADVCLWSTEQAADVVVLGRDGRAAAAWTKMSPDLFSQAKALNGWPN